MKPKSETMIELLINFAQSTGENDWDNGNRQRMCVSTTSFHLKNERRQNEVAESEGE